MVKKKKRVRINKLRFGCFIGVCLMVLFGAGWGVSALVRSKSFKINAETTYTYATHYFFSEALHVSIDEADDIKAYQLVNRNGDVLVNEGYGSTADAAIDLSSLDKGEYFVFFNDTPISVSNDDLADLETVWYTVMRDGQANKVTLESVKDLLVLNVEKVKELPENIYDIIIDPGHGGLDMGTSSGELFESEEALVISKYIASRLEEHGLKVKLTRENEFDPAGEGNFVYEESAFYKNGRVEQVYQHQSKYLISNHLNALDTTLSGFEIYSSIFASDSWAELLSASLTETGHSARDSVKNEFRVSEGSYKKGFVSDEGPLDYLYIIRETGGPATQASKLPNFNENYRSVPNYGPEAILIEYAYIDNMADMEFWSENWQKLGDAVVEATLEYLGIKY